MLSITVSKVIILVGMLITTVVFGMLPYKLIRGRRGFDKWISLATCYSGGVFLTACICDLFPDVRESIDNVLDEIEKEYHSKIDYPVAEFIVMVGFFLILIVEGIVSDWQERMRRRIQLRANNAGHGQDESDPLIARDADDHNDHQQHRSGYGIIGDAEDVPEVEVHGHSHSHQDVVPLEMFVHSKFRACVLLVALSFHSIFEGLAIGLQQTEGQLLEIFFAVVVHKGIMAFALGLELARTELNFRSVAVSVAVFSAASPLGVAIGIGLADMQESFGRDLANGVLQGVSCGTFLYIGLLEILFPELTKPNEERMPKILLALLGFASISALLFVTH